MYVCMSVRSHISKKTFHTSGNFLCMLIVTGARSFSNDSAICFVLPVLWMTSCFHMMGHMARGVGNNNIGAVLQQVVEFLTYFPKGAMHDV